MKQLVLIGGVLLAFMQTVLAQTHQLMGKVSDKKGEALVGVVVTAKGEQKGVTTDASGGFKITVPTATKALVFKYVGFKTKEISIGANKVINAILEEEVNSLDEVVVIGYATVKKKDLTGSVASIGSKDITSTPVPNVAQAIQGKLPGVRITAQDGRPGADIAIRVRGGSSLSQSMQPLVLIDGNPGSLNDIPSDQIERIDVLKDASTIAIYGSRGANGVVLVTTKSGKAGKTVVSYSGYYKNNQPTAYLDALNPYDYLKYVWANAAANGTAFQTPFEKLYGLGVNAGNNTGGIESYRGLASDDIQRQVYNESNSWNHAFTISGGTEKTKMFFSSTYTIDMGMKINSYWKRANSNFKISHKVLDNLLFELNTRYTLNPSLGDEGTTNGSGSLLSTSYKFRPISYDHILGDKTALRSSNIEQYGRNSMWDTYSPVARISDYMPYNKKQNVLAMPSVNWDIIKGLTFHSDFAVTGEWGERKYWSGAVYNGFVDDASGNKLYAGNADYRKSDKWNYRWANTLSYVYNVNKENKLTALVGNEMLNSGGTWLNVNSTRFPANFDKETAFAQISQFDQAKGATVVSSFVEIPYRLKSVFGRLDYSLKDRYMMTLTARRDASSRFPSNHRYATFPSVALAWRLTDEPFMKQIEWINSIKVRGSFGSVGNDGIPANSFSSEWKAVNDQRFQYNLNHNSYQSAYGFQNERPNPDIKWETTITRNLGTDFSLFKNLITGTVDLYHNSTKDLLTLTPLYPESGFTGEYRNIGKVSNKGLELSLSSNVFKTKDWSVSVGANISFNKNNIDELAPGITGLYGANWAGSASYPTSDYILEVGKPIGRIRGLVYDGIYTPDDFNYNNGLYTLKTGVADLGAFMGVIHGLTTSDKPSSQTAYPGLPKYRDQNDDGKIDDKDLTIIGNTAPKHTGGFNVNVAFKNIDLAAQFNWSVGNDIYNATKLASLYGPKEAGVYENKLAILNDSYKIYDVVNGNLVRLKSPEDLNAANVNATLPLAYNEGGVTSTLGIEDGSFLRLNTLTLGYRLNTKIVKAYLYSSIYNAFTITNYSGLDPEVGVNDNYNNSKYPTSGLDFGSYPRARSFVFGVNVNF